MMQYRNSDYGRRRKASRRPSGRVNEGMSSFFSTVSFIFNFLLALMGVSLVAIVAAGWLRFVAFGKVPNDTFWHRLTYDTTHITHHASRVRLIRFAKSVVQPSSEIPVSFY